MDFEGVIMTDNTQYIGKHIISNELGIGEIVEIVDMGDSGEFFKVAFAKGEGTNFFSIENQKNYRLLESKDALEKAIEVFKNHDEKREFSSLQKKIEFYKSSLKSTSVADLAQILAELNNEEEVHTGLKTQFEKALKAFVKEIEFVLGIKNIEAWNLMGLNKNNK